jgi:NAD(P)-dependent dehydrogenase (short-subunit alcohol dehydrogenase family)
MVVDLVAELARETESMLREAGGEAMCVVGDVADSSTLLRAVDLAVGSFGRLDVVHGNTGVGIDKLAVELTVEEWRRVIEVNLTSAFVLGRLALEVMQRQGDGGSIVFTSSAHAVATTGRATAYAASKAGLLGLTRGLAIEGAPYRVRVNALLPGAIDTAMIADYLAASRDPAAERRSFERQQPLDRLGDPEEVAMAVLFVTLNPFVTGAAIPIDGGLLAKLATGIVYDHGTDGADA